MAAALELKVSTRASRNAINGWQDGVLKVSVTAVPENGKANAAVFKLLAKALSLPKSAFRLERGACSPRKRLRVDGEDAAARIAGLSSFP